MDLMEVKDKEVIALEEELDQAERKNEQLESEVYRLEQELLDVSGEAA